MSYQLQGFLHDRHLEGIEGLISGEEKTIPVFLGLEFLGGILGKREGKLSECRETAKKIKLKIDARGQTSA